MKRRTFLLGAFAGTAVLALGVNLYSLNSVYPMIVKVRIIVCYLVYSYL